MKAVRRDEVFIVGGGNSLKDFRFNKLRDKDTIAVNMSALDVPNPTFCITGDSDIFRKVQEGHFEDVKTTWVMILSLDHPVMKWNRGQLIHRSGFVYDLSCVDVIIKSPGLEGIGFSWNDFRRGWNSGFCALQLAVLLGYKKIHLLGIDLTLNEGRCHYHDKYKGRRIGDSTFERFFLNFEFALNILKSKTDIKVISRSSISRLNEFIPYIPLGDV